jgi:hypothetical protein
MESDEMYYYIVIHQIFIEPLYINNKVLTNSPYQFVYFPNNRMETLLHLIIKCFKNDMVILNLL